MIKNIYWYS